MELPNRKQRRQWAKEMGLLKEKSKMPLEKKLEISRRAREAGEQIHLRNTERNLERESKRKEEIEAKKREEELSTLISKGHSVEEAMAMLAEKNDENDGALDSQGQ
jgi:hypothetical protein